MNGTKYHLDDKKKKKERKALFLGFLILVLAVYGLSMMILSLWDTFIVVDNQVFVKRDIPMKLSPELGQPGQPTPIPDCDFYNIERSLESIRVELQRMNDIQSERR